MSADAAVPARVEPATTLPEPTSVSLLPGGGLGHGWSEARPPRRPWGLWAGFVLYVLAPCAAVAWYLTSEAVDQYASTTGFSVRAEEVGSAVELLGGVADLGGSSARSDADLLNAFIGSEAMVRAVESRLDLSAIWSRPHARDPIFALDPDGTIEDLADYWHRMVHVTHDSGAGLLEVEARAFDPEDARAIAQSIFDLSTERINALSAIAAADTTRNAARDLADATERLKSAREALTAYRSANQMVSPGTDMPARMGVLAALEQSLADEMIRLDELRAQTRAGDTRLRIGQQRIAAIEARIAEERAEIGAGDTGGDSTDLAQVVAGFERLQVERELAEAAYAAAQTAHDVAVAEARRQTRYLAAYMTPTLAERAAYPDKPLILALTAFFAVAIWGIGAMLIHSLRDRR